MADQPVFSWRQSPPKRPEGFRVLIVYPNLPMMLVPSIAIAIFTRLFRDQGYQLSLFETTHYDTHETNFSEVEINFSENKINLMNVREFSLEEDLGIKAKTGMLADFRKKVVEFNPDFMIYSVVEDTFLQTLSMMREIEDLGIPHLIGGVYPTMAPQMVIDAPEVQLIGLGEGENTVVEVSRALCEGREPLGIPGTWVKSQTGEIKRHPQSPLVDIGRVCPDFTLFDESRFMRPMGGRVFKMIPIESYRGCPYNCTYCNSPSQRIFVKENELGNYMRRKPIEMLRDNLRTYMDLYDPEFFFFVDDSFLARPREENFEFFDMYEEFRLPFYFNTRSENCDPEILARLKEVGCYRMAFGIEAGNEQFRNKVLKRKISNAEIIKRFKWISESGIAFSINVIIGYPGETREMVMDTVELVRAIQGYDSLTSFIFTPYNGTALRKVAVDNGWYNPRNITKHNTSRSLLEMPPPYLNADEIDGMLAVLPLYCYFPKEEWPRIRLAEGNDDKAMAIRKEYSEIYAMNFLSGTQDDEKTFIVGEAAHWGSDPETYFKSSPDRLTPEMLKSLVSTGSPLDI